MTDNLRKALYTLISVAVLALTAAGVLTQQQGVVWANVGVLAIGFAYAASRARNNLLLDASVRRAGYVLLPAIIALIAAYWSIDVALWTSVATALVGTWVAIYNIDPGEVIDISDGSA
jgi:hypothetical protein